MARSTFFAVVWLAVSLTVAGADEPPGAMLDAAARDALSATIRGILVESLPEKIAGQDDWGETKRGFSGLTWRLDGLKLEVEKREKDVKNGLWKKWEIVPVDPARNLIFRIESAQSTGPTRFAFRIVAASPLAVTAHAERWRSGVKMLNGTVEADATVAATLVGDLEYRFETIEGRVNAVIVPRVTAVDLALIDMRWKRVSKFDGPAIHELGELLEDPVGDQLDKQEPKAVEKLNAAITKRQDKMKFAVPGAVDFSRWSIKAGELFDALK